MLLIYCNNRSPAARHRAHRRDRYPRAFRPIRGRPYNGRVRSVIVWSIVPDQ